MTLTFSIAKNYANPSGSLAVASASFAPNPLAIGDRVYFAVFSDNGDGGLTAPGTVSPLITPFDPDGALWLGGWFLDITSTPPTDFTFTHTGTAGPFYVQAVAIRASGATFLSHTANFVGNTGGDATLVYPDLTGAGDERAMILFGAHDNADTVATPPSGMTPLQTEPGAASGMVTYGQASIGTGAQGKTLIWGAADQSGGWNVIVSYTATATSKEADARAMPRGLGKGLNRGMQMVRAASGLFVPSPKRILIPVGVSL